MTQVFNQFSERKKRQQLRTNPTHPEQVLWKRLRERQLDGFKFRRQYSVGRYVVDFYCVEARLVIEVDGDSHFSDDALAYDKERTEFLEALGLTVLRFTNTEVRRTLDGVITRIREALARL